MPIPPNINNAYKVSPSRNNNINFNYIWDEGNQYWSPKAESSLSYDAVVGSAADFIHKFGSNPNIPTTVSVSSPETVWDGSTEYTFPPDSGTGIQIKSSESVDTQEFVVEGLDQNFLKQTWTGDLNGANNVDIDGTWTRVYRAFNNDSPPISGDINIHGDGDDSATFAKVLAGHDQTLMALYTVPSNYTGYLVQYHSSAHNPGSASAIGYTIHLKTRKYGKVFRTQEIYSVTTASFASQHLPFPVQLPPKTDIIINVVDANGNGGAVNTDFDIALHQGAGKTI